MRHHALTKCHHQKCRHQNIIGKPESTLVSPGRMPKIMFFNMATLTFDLDRQTHSRWSSYIATPNFLVHTSNGSHVRALADGRAHTWPILYPRPLMPEGMRVEQWAIPFFVRTSLWMVLDFRPDFFFVLHYGRFCIFDKNCNIIHTLHWILHL